MNVQLAIVLHHYSDIGLHKAGYQCVDLLKPASRAYELNLATRFLFRRAESSTFLAKYSFIYLPTYALHYARRATASRLIYYAYFLLTHYHG
jgi:hypothetical protein